MAAQIAVARPSISHHFPFCKPPEHVAMNYLTCHLFTVFASYFEFAAFSSLAIPCADRRKTLETAAQRSSLHVHNWLFGNPVTLCSYAHGHYNELGNVTGCPSAFEAAHLPSKLPICLSSTAGHAARTDNLWAHPWAEE
jgi:hypothetical protein